MPDCQCRKNQLQLPLYKNRKPDYIRHIVRTKILTLLLILVCFSGLSQTSVQFILSDPQYGISQTTNVQITLQAENVQIGGPVTLLPFTLYQTTGTNGSATFTNLFGGPTQGFYHWTIPINPVQNADGDIWVSSTNLGTINASLIGVVFGANTYPAGWWTWSATAADQRYTLSTNNQLSYVLIGQLLATSNAIVAQIPSTNGFVGAGVTNGLLGRVEAAEIYYPTSNPSQFVTSAITNGLVNTNQLAGLTNGFATTNFVASAIASSNAPLATTNFVVGQIQIATNGLASTNQLLIYTSTNVYVFGTNNIATNAAANLLSTSNILAAANTTSSNSLVGFINTGSNLLQQTKQPASNTLTNLSATGAFTNKLNALAPYIYFQTNVSGDTVSIGGTNIPTTNNLAATNWVSSNFYPLGSNPSNYVTTGQLPTTNGFLTTAQAALLYYPTSNPNSFVTQSITNGLASSNQVVAVTNGMTTLTTTNPATILYTNALPALTNGFIGNVQLNAASNSLIITINGTNGLILQQVTNLVNAMGLNLTNLNTLSYLTLSNDLYIGSNYLDTNFTFQIFSSTNGLALPMNGVITNTTTNTVFSYLGTNAILAIASTVAGTNGGGTTNFILGFNTNSVVGGYTTNNNFTAQGTNAIVYLIGQFGINPTNGISAVTATNISAYQAFISTNGLWNSTTNLVGITSNSLSSQIAAISGGTTNFILGLNPSSVVTNWTTNNSFSVTGTNVIASIGDGMFILNSNGFGTNTVLTNSININVTNLEVVNNTWLNNSNIEFHLVSGGALIPVMTATNAPSGLVTISPTNQAPWQCFNPSYAEMTDIIETNTSWIQYQFASPEIVGSFSGYFGAEDGTSLNVIIQGSSDGVTWNTIYSANAITPTSFPGYYISNSIAPVTYQYWRWTSTCVTDSDALSWSQLQLYGNELNLVSNSPAIEVLATNGMSLSTPQEAPWTLTVASNINALGQIEINGIPIGSLAQTLNYGQLFVSGAAYAPYNGIYTSVGYVPVYTNDANTCALLLQGEYNFDGNGFGIGSSAYFVTNAATAGQITNIPVYLNTAILGTYQSAFTGSILPAPTVSPYISPTNSVSNQQVFWVSNDTSQLPLAQLPAICYTLLGGEFFKTNSTYDTNGWLLIQHDP
jgi:hypothetical protein